MGQFSLANLFGVTIRESANDGSDFTNPDADYRRLFLGEDGLLHLKDSAGTVTDIGGSSGIPATIFDVKGDIIAATAADTAARLAAGANGTFLEAQSGQTTGLKWSALASGKTKRTAGDVVLNAGAFAAIDAALDITITTGARRCLCTVTGSAFGSTTGSIAAFDIQIDGALQGTATYGLELDSTDNKSHDISFSYITDVLTAGSHTFKLYGSDAGAGTATVYASDPALIFAVAELMS